MRQPVAWASSLDFDDDDQEIIPAKDKGKLGTSNCDIPLYTAPKQWVGLTDEERHNIREWQEIQKELGPVWAPMMLYLYLAIEAKLKEKNT